jgi:hypothetical protein
MWAVLQQRGDGGHWSCMARNVSSGHRGEPRRTLRSATKQVCVVHHPLTKASLVTLTRTTLVVTQVTSN